MQTCRAHLGLIDVFSTLDKNDLVWALMKTYVLLKEFYSNQLGLNKIVHSVGT